MDFLLFTKIFFYSLFELNFFNLKYFIFRYLTDVFNQLLEILKRYQILFVLESVKDSLDSVFNFTFCANSKTEDKLSKVKPRFVILIKALEYFSDEKWFSL